MRTRITWALATALAIAAIAATVCAPAAAATTATTSQPAGGAMRRMAFVMRQGSVNHIYLRNISAAGKGSDPVRLTHDAEAENFPSWSPDGTRLAYQRDLDGSAIDVSNADGTGERRLSPIPGFDAAPSWSPDGTQIVYTRLHAAPQPNHPPLTDIRVMRADGTGDHAILASTLFNGEPRWSVNGQIVFMSLAGSQ